MGQRVDELSLLGIMWNKNVENFTQVLCRTQFRLIIFGAFTHHSDIVRPFFYGYSFKQSFTDRNTTYFFVNQSDDVGFGRIR